MITDFVFNSQSVTAECALSKNIVFLAARYASDAVVDIPETARNALQKIGYRQQEFNAADCTVVTSLIEQGKSARETRLAELEDDEIDQITVSHQTNVFAK